MLSYILWSNSFTHVYHLLTSHWCLFAVPRLFTPEIASFYEKYYKGKGVNIIKGTSVTAFEKDDQGNVSICYQTLYWLNPKGMWC